MKNTGKVHIGTRIRTRREELSMTQEELAEKMGYKSRSTINKIELGKNDIPQNKIEAFARVLSIPPSLLMGWNDVYLPQNSNNKTTDSCAPSVGMPTRMHDLLSQLNEQVKDLDKSSLLELVEFAKFLKLRNNK